MSDPDSRTGALYRAISRAAIEQYTTCMKVGVVRSILGLGAVPVPRAPFAFEFAASERGFGGFTGATAAFWSRHAKVVLQQQQQQREFQMRFQALRLPMPLRVPPPPALGKMVLAKRLIAFEDARAKVGRRMQWEEKRKEEEEEEGEEKGEKRYEEDDLEEKDRAGENELLDFVHRLWHCTVAENLRLDEAAEPGDGTNIISLSERRFCMTACLPACLPD